MSELTSSKWLSLLKVIYCPLLGRLNLAYGLFLMSRLTNCILPKMFGMWQLSRRRQSIRTGLLLQQNRWIWLIGSLWAHSSTAVAHWLVVSSSRSLRFILPINHLLLNPLIKLIVKPNRSSSLLWTLLPLKDLIFKTSVLIVIDYHVY